MGVPLLRFLLFSLAFAAVYALAVLTPVGQRVDAVSLGSFPGLRDGRLMDLYGFRGFGVIALCAVATVCAIAAGFRRRYAAAGRAIAVIAATALASFALDVLLVRPDLGVSGYLYNTYPSGHAALGLAAVVAVAWTWPRPDSVVAVALLAAGALAVGLFSWLSFAHRASDIIGGALLVGGVSALMSLSARGRATPPRKPWNHRRAFDVIVGVLLVVASVCLLFATVSGDSLAAALVGIAAVTGFAALIVLVVGHVWFLRREQEEPAGSMRTSVEE